MKTWSKKERAELKEKYPKEGWRACQLCLKRHSRYAVIKRANMEGASAWRRVIWSDEKIAYLAQHHRTMPLGKMAKQLRMPLRSVAIKVVGLIDNKTSNHDWRLALIAAFALSVV